MVVIPCSMKRLSAVVHTENIHRAALAGIEIVPPVPGFYTWPESVDDVVNFVAGKVVKLLGREDNLFENWGKREL